MTDVVLLDSGPLGIIVIAEAISWLSGLLAADTRIVVPEIADFEVRRESSEPGGIRASNGLIA